MNDSLKVAWGVLKVAKSRLALKPGDPDSWKLLDQAEIAFGLAIQREAILICWEHELSDSTISNMGLLRFAIEDLVIEDDNE